MLARYRHVDWGCPLSCSHYNLQNSYIDIWSMIMCSRCWIQLFSVHLWLLSCVLIIAFHSHFSFENVCITCMRILSFGWGFPGWLWCVCIVAKVYFWARVGWGWFAFQKMLRTYSVLSRWKPILASNSVIAIYSFSPCQTSAWILFLGGKWVKNKWLWAWTLWFITKTIMCLAPFGIPPTNCVCTVWTMLKWTNPHHYHTIILDSSVWNMMKTYILKYVSTWKTNFAERISHLSHHSKLRSRYTSTIFQTGFFFFI